jgi:hypothetical protein
VRVEAWPASHEAELRKFCNIISELATASNMRVSPPMWLTRVDAHQRLSPVVDAES